MIFTPGQISQIVEGTKTQTRLIAQTGEWLGGGPFEVGGKQFEAPLAVYTGVMPHERLKWMVGRDYAVQPGSNKPGVWVHWNHPCNGIDIWNDINTTDKKAATGQGYAPLRIKLLHIRREPLKEIREEDAIAEGCQGVGCNMCGGKGWYVGMRMEMDPINPYGEPIPIPVQEQCMCFGGYEAPPSFEFVAWWDTTHTHKWNDVKDVWTLTFEIATEVV